MKWRAQSIIKHPFKKVYIFTCDNRDIANCVSSNKCRLVCVLDMWLKNALKDSALVGLSEYVYQNAINTFLTNFPKKVFYKKKVSSRGSGVNNVSNIAMTCTQVMPIYSRLLTSAYCQTSEAV